MDSRASRGAKRSPGRSRRASAGAASDGERYPLTRVFRWAHRLRDGLRQPWPGFLGTHRVPSSARLDIRAAGATAAGVRATLTVMIADATCPRRYAVAVVDCELRRDGRALVAGSPGLPAGRVSCRTFTRGEGAEGGEDAEGAPAVVDAVAIVGDLLPLRAVAADLAA